MKSTILLLNTRRLIVILAILATLTSGISGQSPWQRLANEEDALGLGKGYIESETQEFLVKLVSESQTIASLQPQGTEDFDFTPSEWLETRKGNRLYHLGDLNLRLKKVGARRWDNYSTAAERHPVTPLETGNDQGIIAAADITPTLGADIPLDVKRYWENSKEGLVLRFSLTNTSDAPVELGSVGIPMIFNNILQGKSLEEAHAKCSFYDPYIGQDAGYLQVTRLHGHGPVLLVLPWKDTPMEAYNPLLDDRTPRGITFEGFYEWMPLSKAYAEQEWSEADPWNPPHSIRLNPGESHEFGVRFVLSPSIRDIEATLTKYNRPVAVGIPGYVVPMDIKADLFLRYGSDVKSIDISPGGALLVKRVEDTPGGWKKYEVTPSSWGRARMTVTYEDGLTQTIQYKVIKPEKEVVDDLGRFLTTEQWFEDPDDPFGRNLSVISYDYGLMKQVTQDNRAWIAGLSDEGGAGSWLAAMMKQLVDPNPEELKKMEQFVNNTLWGGIQYKDGDKKYGVRKSMFYYDPENMPEGTYSDQINWKTWSAWPPKEAKSTGRSYNYPHVAAAWWVMYQLTRNNNIETGASWDWYLEQAYHTALAMVDQAPYYAQFGQMEGTVFFLILLDLQREGKDDMALELEKVMKSRADLWKTLKYPFGSEMPWDSTGQEEVYMWSKYFGYTDKAEITLNAILAYMPAVPHWGYNGSARRYWDFQYAGKLQRVERQLHHYGSALNAIPVLSEYRDHPDDLYLLRVGHAGMMGALSNITPEGFAPAAFHAYPSTLREDYLSGDYGTGFFGYAVNSGSYLALDKDLGWLAFGGNIDIEGNLVTIKPATSSRTRVFIAPARLWLTLDAGRFSSVTYNTETGSVSISFDTATDLTTEARLRIEMSKGSTSGYSPSKRMSVERGAVVVPLKKSTSLTLEKK